MSYMRQWGTSTYTVLWLNVACPLTPCLHIVEKKAKDMRNVSSGLFSSG